MPARKLTNKDLNKTVYLTPNNKPATLVQFDNEKKLAWVMKVGRGLTTIVDYEDLRFKK